MKSCHRHWKISTGELYSWSELLHICIFLYYDNLTLIKDSLQVLNFPSAVICSIYTQSLFFYLEYHKIAYLFLVLENERDCFRLKIQIMNVSYIHTLKSCSHIYTYKIIYISERWSTSKTSKLEILHKNKENTRNWLFFKTSTITVNYTYLWQFTSDKIVCGR